MDALGELSLRVLNFVWLAAPMFSNTVGDATDDTWLQASVIKACCTRPCRLQWKFNRSSSTGIQNRIAVNVKTRLIVRLVSAKTNQNCRRRLDLTNVSTDWSICDVRAPRRVRTNRCLNSRSDKHIRDVLGVV